MRICISVDLHNIYQAIEAPAGCQKGEVVPSWFGFWLCGECDAIYKL